MSDFVSIGSQNSMSPFSTPNRQAIRPQQQQSFGGGLSPSTSGGGYHQQQQQHRPVTLEDIEADIGRQQSANRYQMNNNSPKPISLAELEAALASGGLRTPQFQQVSPADPALSPFGFAQPNPMQLMAMKQQQELKGQQEQLARDNQRKEHVQKVCT